MMYFDEAMRVLLANKIRSLLTVTGLIIGVGAVIAIQVLGTAMAGAVNGALGPLSDNSFVIFPNTQQADTTKATMTLRDLDAIRSSIPGLASVQPSVGETDVIRVGHHTARYRISGDGKLPVNNLPLLYGRKITQDDVDAATNVAVISNDAYSRLFPEGGDPTGRNIYAGSRRYLVVGVLTAPKRGLLNATFGGDIAVPWTTYVNYYVRGDNIVAGVFFAADPAQIPELELQVQNKLKDLHGNAKGIQYQSIDKAQFTQSVGGIFAVITAVVAIIGAISLLVAGIGIMNIMLVSVAERTREIGVRKAIGARSGQILWQFLIEAFTLCGVGCTTGLVIGLSIGALVNDVFIVKFTGTITALPWVESVIIAATFAVAATVGCGLIPAFLAARLNPIEALRYE